VELRDDEICAKSVQNSPLLPLEGLSSGEQDRFTLEIFLQLARFSAITTPTVLILDQSRFPSLDKAGLNYLLRSLSREELPFQVVVSLYSWPADLDWSCWRVWSLKGASLSDTPVEIQAGFHTSEDLTN
jgi:hypothetical protein